MSLALPGQRQLGHLQGHTPVRHESPLGNVNLADGTSGGFVGT